MKAYAFVVLLSLGLVGFMFPDYFPLETDVYCHKTFTWTHGTTGEFVTQPHGPVQVPYTAGTITGTLITNLDMCDRRGFYNDGTEFKFMSCKNLDSIHSYYLSTDCDLTDHPAAWSFSELNDGDLIDQRPYYVVRSDLAECTEENTQMLLVHVQDVTVLHGAFPGAVIFWYLDTTIPFSPLNFFGKETDLGITLPESTDTGGYGIKSFTIFGLNTGPIAVGDVSASGTLNSLIEHDRVSCTDWFGASSVLDAEFSRPSHAVNYLFLVLAPAAVLIAWRRLVRARG